MDLKIKAEEQQHVVATQRFNVDLKHFTVVDAGCNSHMSHHTTEINWTSSNFTVTHQMNTKSKLINAAFLSRVTQ